ncbi:MAG: superoxide dismutase [Nanoarchaeota archaeon]
MTHTLAPLPFAYDALDPWVDERTMRIHHGKHHQGYVDKLNAALAGHEGLAKKSVKELISHPEAVPTELRGKVRNFGGGVWNHTFFWNVLGKNDGTIGGPVEQAIMTGWGSVEKFKDAFSVSAASLFGSGWTWLVIKDCKLAIMNTANQDSPINEGITPILTIDVWEHAYYLQYQQKRPEFIEKYFAFIDWKKVNTLFAQVR